jgi:hypothetical protein
VKFIQYVRSVAIIQPPKTSQDKPKETPDKWQPDGSKTSYPGTLTLPSGAGADSGGMADMPGLPGSSIADTGKLAETLLKAKKYGEGAKFTYRIELETFICCDEKLLGFVTWSIDLTWTMDDKGTVTGPVATPNTPGWNEPDAKSENKKDVDCTK